MQGYGRIWKNLEDKERALITMMASRLRKPPPRGVAHGSGWQPFQRQADESPALKARPQHSASWEEAPYSTCSLDLNWVVHFQAWEVFSLEKPAHRSVWETV